MTQYDVTGMSCAACSARVEKAVSSVKGVDSCAVSLLTNSMGVEGSASPDEIIKAVENAGYGAALKNEDKTRDDKESLEDKETPKLLKRLIISALILLPLMYISMGHMMWGWPLPSFLSGHISMGIAEMVLALAVMIINRKFFISGTKGVIHKSPNMDTLVAMGSGVSFIYSVWILIDLIINKGNEMPDFYFESAAMILTLITVGKTLEAYSKGKTTSAIKSLMSLAPETATVLIDGKETEIPVDKVKVDDIFIVKTGGKIPVDGVIIEGNASIDESALTGESIPVDKSVGDGISSATVNMSGYIKCRATQVGEDTSLSKIIRMVSDAAATKAPIAKTADRVSGVFVPVVICIGVIAFAVWLIAGKEFGYALSRGISVLVISCPCALGLATPVAIMVGSGKAARNGIIFKTAASLEEAGRVSIVALDKTGTITNGTPGVTDIITADGVSEDELINAAYSLEIKSEHPLARAVVQYAQEKKAQLSETENFVSIAGNGLSANAGDKKLTAGKFDYISDIAEINEETKEKAQSLSSEGKTPLFFAENNKLLGIIAVADTIKDDSAEAVNELRNMGIRVVMLTGDNSITANAIGRQAGVDEVISDVLPGEKESVIKALQKSGKTAMVGDGINDAPALTRADVGIAIGTGTDIAVDSAEIVLMNSRLTDVSAAIRLSRRTLLNIKENLFWAFIYNIIGIPLAAGVWIPLTGWTLNPMFGAAAMSLSSFCVVMNALRLNLVDIHSTKHDKTKNIKIKENKTMTKTIKVEGMMCPHCEAHVKEALEAIKGVAKADASHTEKKVEIVLESEVQNEVLYDAIKKAGYKVIE